MSEHSEPRPERDVDEMEERTERLEHEIDDAREDWERKKSDASVPGAPPDEDDADGPDTGAKYPTKRDAD